MVKKKNEKEGNKVALCTQTVSHPPQNLLLFSIVDEEEEFTGFVDR